MKKILSKVFYSYIDSSYKLRHKHTNSTNYQKLIQQRTLLQNKLLFLRQIQQKLSPFPIQSQLSTISSNFTKIAYFEKEFVRFFIRNLSEKTLLQTFYLQSLTTPKNRLKLTNALYNYHQTHKTELSFYLVLSLILDVLQVVQRNKNSAANLTLLGRILVDNLAGFEFVQGQFDRFVDAPYEYVCGFCEMNAKREMDDLSEVEVFSEGIGLDFIDEQHQRCFQAFQRQQGWKKFDVNVEQNFKLEELCMLDWYDYLLNKAQFACYKECVFEFQEEVVLNNWQTKKLY